MGGVEGAIDGWLGNGSPQVSFIILCVDRSPEDVRDRPVKSLGESVWLRYVREHASDVYVKEFA